MLIRQAKSLRKLVYNTDETMKEKMPKKREASGLLEDQIAYTKELLELVKEDERFTTVPAIKEQIDYLEEIIMIQKMRLNIQKIMKRRWVTKQLTHHFRIQNTYCHDTRKNNNSSSCNNRRKT